ncbi:DUF397 domain-containing protein [Mangrovactinospora gilvigrisea]|uniref:DUF397 domain-containing protein n=1 Tax=Mangrovactinospora gilvigrisea TaxID=1428644 RepID=A0A1J7BWQ6_9ACTN|nr:DUF397 domain-containing protein [Mangrovactinospora gilvigrisea]OIV37897.1 DUF397 domain-containing protein [Mangrovactinospora gilvigrisea]
MSSEPFPTGAPSAVPAPSLVGAAWRKSSHSNPSGDCVEFAPVAAGTVAVRNSRDPQGVALLCSTAVLGDFLRAAKEGEFDDLIRGGSSR